MVPILLLPFLGRPFAGARMPQRAIQRSRRRGAVSLRAHNWEMEPSIWGGAQLTPDWDAVRYDDVIRPALRVRATLVVDDDGEPESLINLVRDDVRA